VNQFAGFLGLTGRSRCQQTELFDIINIIKKIEIRRAGAFGERMWLSKKENFRKRTCFCFAFLTANPGKP
jgi:hypothetical protein